MERKDFLFASLRTIIGCALFAVGFNIFLAPSELNAGGISGLLTDLPVCLFLIIPPGFWVLHPHEDIC